MASPIMDNVPTALGVMAAVMSILSFGLLFGETYLTVASLVSLVFSSAPVLVEAALVSVGIVFARFVELTEHDNIAAKYSMRLLGPAMSFAFVCAVMAYGLVLAQKVLLSCQQAVVRQVHRLQDALCLDHGAYRALEKEFLLLVKKFEGLPARCNQLEDQIRDICGQCRKVHEKIADLGYYWIAEKLDIPSPETRQLLDTPKDTPEGTRPNILESLLLRRDWRLQPLEEKVNDFTECIKSHEKREKLLLDEQTKVSSTLGHFESRLNEGKARAEAPIPPIPKCPASVKRIRFPFDETPNVYAAKPVQPAQPAQPTEPAVELPAPAPAHAPTADDFRVAVERLEAIKREFKPLTPLERKELAKERIRAERRLAKADAPVTAPQVAAEVAPVEVAAEVATRVEETEEEAPVSMLVVSVQVVNAPEPGLSSILEDDIVEPEVTTSLELAEEEEDEEEENEDEDDDAVVSQDAANDAEVSQEAAYDEVPSSADDLMEVESLGLPTIITESVSAQMQLVDSDPCRYTEEVCQPATYEPEPEPIDMDIDLDDQTALDEVCPVVDASEPMEVDEVDFAPAQEPEPEHIDTDDIDVELEEEDLTPSEWDSSDFDDQTDVEEAGPVVDASEPMEVGEVDLAPAEQLVPQVQVHHLPPRPGVVPSAQYIQRLLEKDADEWERMHDAAEELVTMLRELETEPGFRLESSSLKRRIEDIAGGPEAVELPEIAHRGEVMVLRHPPPPPPPPPRAPTQEELELQEFEAENADLLREMEVDMLMEAYANERVFRAPNRNWYEGLVNNPPPPHVVAAAQAAQVARDAAARVALERTKRRWIWSSRLTTREFENGLTVKYRKEGVVSTKPYHLGEIVRLISLLRVAKKNQLRRQSGFAQRSRLATLLTLTSTSLSGPARRPEPPRVQRDHLLDMIRFRRRGMRPRH